MRQEIQRRATNTSRVREWFLSHPWQWVDTRTLELLGGRQAWRTRCSDARIALRKEGLGTIVNRLRRDADGVVCSEYRYEPEFVGARGKAEVWMVDGAGELVGRLF